MRDQHFPKIKRSEKGVSKTLKSIHREHLLGTMSMDADLLSNEELLGLHEDGTNRNDDIKTEQQIEVKPKRRYHKLDDELMLSSRGLPELIKSLSKYRFRGKKRPAEMSSYERYVNKRYDRSIHFENLTRLLHVYQIWGHEVYPKYKFRDFTGVLNRAASSPALKEYKRSVIRKEVDEKLKIEAEKNDAYAQHLGEEPNALTSATRVTSSEPEESAMTNDVSSGLFVGEDAVMEPNQMDWEDEPLYSVANRYEEQNEKERRSDADFMEQIGKDMAHVGELSAAGEGDKKKDGKEDEKSEKNDEKSEKSENSTEKNDESKEEKNREKDDDDILGILLSDDERDEDTQMKVGNTSLIAEKDADLKRIDEDNEGEDTKNGKEEKQDNANEDEDSYMDNIMHEMGI